MNRPGERANADATFEWNAALYQRVSSPQQAWGKKVLDSLALRGDEAALDAGCGTGLVTALLLERLPSGSVFALDASQAMLELAQRNLAPFGGRVTFVRADLARDRLPTGFELVFSTATFHWIHDHDALFRNLAGALAVDGRLCAQCGGAGNLERARALIAEVSRLPSYASFLEHMPEPWFFAGVEDTRRRLSRAGFGALEVWLSDEPTHFDGPEAYAGFMRASVLPALLERLPESLQAGFVDQITTRAADSAAGLSLDYVRLNIRACAEGRD